MGWGERDITVQGQRLQGDRVRGKGEINGEPVNANRGKVGQERAGSFGLFLVVEERPDAGGIRSKSQR